MFFFSSQVCITVMHFSWDIFEVIMLLSTFLMCNMLYVPEFPKSLLSVSVCFVMSVSAASHRIFIMRNWGAPLQQALSPTGNNRERQEKMAPIGPGLAAGVTQGHCWQRKRPRLCRCGGERGEMGRGKYYIWPLSNLNLVSGPQIEHLTGHNCLHKYCQILQSEVISLSLSLSLSFPLFSHSQKLLIQDLSDLSSLAHRQS